MIKSRLGKITKVFRAGRLSSNLLPSFSTGILAQSIGLHIPVVGRVLVNGEIGADICRRSG